MPDFTVQVKKYAADEENDENYHPLLKKCKVFKVTND